MPSRFDMALGAGAILGLVNLEAPNSIFYSCTWGTIDSSNPAYCTQRSSKAFGLYIFEAPVSPFNSCLSVGDGQER